MNKFDLSRELDRPCAHELVSDGHAVGMTTFQRVEMFHQKMGLPFNDTPVTPTVSERILRGTLMLEEFMEFLEDGLGLRLSYGPISTKSTIMGLVRDKLKVVHMEGDMYDPVETLDGINDMKVIADGTGVAFGLPVDQGDWEVFCSNMSKLDANGEPVVNQCKHYGGDKRIPIVDFTTNPIAVDVSICHNRERYNTCDDLNHLIDPTKPVGKLLKGPYYTPANLTRVIIEAQPDDEMNATREWLLTHARNA